MTTMELRKSALRSASRPAPSVRPRRSRLAAFVELLFLWQERWAQRERLSAFDEHLLRDIGLSRADAVREADKPFWRG